jgi:hypothetical protein
VVPGNESPGETRYEKKHSQEKAGPPMHHDKNAASQGYFIGMLFFKPLDYTGHWDNTLSI